VIGVVLTGLLDDGTSGLMVVRANGGEAVIEDPQTASFSSMPKNALERVPDAHVASLADIPDLLVQLVSEELRPRLPFAKPDVNAAREVRMAELDMSQVESEIRSGKPSAFACPECGGVLWEIDEKGLLRFRCRVGHAYTASHLRAEQRVAIETALWAALRALEENVSLYRRMAERTRSPKFDAVPRAYEERAAAAEANARVLRDFLVRVNTEDLGADESVLLRKAG
jgi:two-component system chemotaxis response regulator CheB